MLTSHSTMKFGTNQHPWEDWILNLFTAGEAALLGGIYATAFQRTGLTWNRSALIAISLVAAEFAALLSIGHLCKQHKISRFTAISLSAATYVLPKTVFITALTVAKLIPPPGAFLVFVFFASQALRELDTAWEQASLADRYL